MDISERVEVEGHEKCIFETPHKEIKCVLSNKESNFNGKMGQNFHGRAEGTDTPPPLTISLTVKRPFFLTTSLTKGVISDERCLTMNISERNRRYM